MTKIRTPVLVINFKNYPTSTTQNAVTLAKICEEEADAAGVSLILCPSFMDLEKVRQSVKCPVFSQHIDTHTLGKSTGRVVPELIKNIGCEGSLINHSEHQIIIKKNELDLELIKNTIHRGKEAGLVTITCAETPDASAEIAKFAPDFIAIEPPELIGGTVSVSKAKPEVITNTITKVHEIAQIPVLCGAGVQNAEDVKKALELGAKGILIASAITTAKDQRAAVKEILKGF